MHLLKRLNYIPNTANTIIKSAYSIMYHYSFSIILKITQHCIQHLNIRIIKFIQVGCINIQNQHEVILLLLFFLLLLKMMLEFSRIGRHTFSVKRKFLTVVIVFVIRLCLRGQERGAGEQYSCDLSF